jgi:hypothetical protein
LVEDRRPLAADFGGAAGTNLLRREQPDAAVVVLVVVPGEEVPEEFLQELFSIGQVRNAVWRPVKDSAVLKEW